MSFTLLNFILLICSISIYIISYETEKEYDVIDYSILRDVKNQNTFSLVDYTDFEWDTVFVRRAYIQLDIFVKENKLKNYNKFKSQLKSIEYDDSIVLLIFSKNNTIVSYDKLNRNFIDFDFKNKGYSTIIKNKEILNMNINSSNVVMISKN